MPPAVSQIPKEVTLSMMDVNWHDLRRLSLKHELELDDLVSQIVLAHLASHRVSAIEAHALNLKFGNDDIRKIRRQRSRHNQCSRCGVPADQVGPGCKVCISRHKMRADRNTIRGKRRDHDRS